MTVISNRSGLPRPQGRRGTRAGLAVLALLGVLLVTACGMNAQTLKPYTPAEGVNFDVGDLNNPDSVIHVRNLLIISRSPGSGIVSASMVTTGTDSLTGVSGAGYKVDGTKGAAFTATLAGPVSLTPNNLVVLTTMPSLLTVSGGDLTAGLDAEVTLQFGKAGSHTVRTTVVDGTMAPYETISPSAAASASPSASPSA